MGKDKWGGLDGEALHKLKRETNLSYAELATYLAQNGVKSPRTGLAYSPESVKTAIYNSNSYKGMREVRKKQRTKLLKKQKALAARAAENTRRLKDAKP